MSRFSTILAAAMALLCWGPVAHADDGARSEGPIEIAAAYLEAMESSELDRAGALFSEHSSIFESGSQEGSWSDYREHHIGPELEHILVFQIGRGTPQVESSEDGSMSFVAWPIEYHIELEGGRTVDSRGTVSFVIILEEGTQRIRHLHWSSRPKS